MERVNTKKKGPHRSTGGVPRILSGSGLANLESNGELHPYRHFLISIQSRGETVDIGNRQSGIVKGLVSRSLGNPKVLHDATLVDEEEDNCSTTNTRITE